MTPESLDLYLRLLPIGNDHGEIHREGEDVLVRDGWLGVPAHLVQRDAAGAIAFAVEGPLWIVRVETLRRRVPAWKRRAEAGAWAVEVLARFDERHPVAPVELGDVEPRHVPADELEAHLEVLTWGFDTKPDDEAWTVAWEAARVPGGLVSAIEAGRRGDDAFVRALGATLVRGLTAGLPPDPPTEEVLSLVDADDARRSAVLGAFADVVRAAKGTPRMAQRMAAVAALHGAPRNAVNWAVSALPGADRRAARALAADLLRASVPRPSVAEMDAALAETHAYLRSRRARIGAHRLGERR